MPNTEYTGNLANSELGGMLLDPAAITVNVGVVTVFVVPDEKCADRISRLLHMARESKHHTAMNILTEQLFLGEHAAQVLLHMLYEETNPIEVGNDTSKPN